MLSTLLSSAFRIATRRRMSRTIGTIRTIATIRTTTAQIQIHSRQGKPRRQNRCLGWRSLKTKHAAAVLATKMDMRFMLARCGCRKAKDPVNIRILVRQPAFNQPIENAVKRHPIQRWSPQIQLDFIVRKRSRCITQQLQNTDARRRRSSPCSADKLGDDFIA